MPVMRAKGFDVIKTVQTLEQRLAHIAEPITLSIIGCVVNGPGEARETISVLPVAAAKRAWSIWPVSPTIKSRMTKWSTIWSGWWKTKRPKWRRKSN